MSTAAPIASRRGPFLPRSRGPPFVSAAGLGEAKSASPGCWAGSNCGHGGYSGSRSVTAGEVIVGADPNPPPLASLTLADCALGLIVCPHARQKCAAALAAETR